MGIKFGDTMALIESMGETHLTGLIGKFNSLQDAVAGATGAVSGASNSAGGTANPRHGTPPSIEAINAHNATWDPRIAAARADVEAHRALIASYTNEEWGVKRIAANNRLRYLKDRVGTLVDQKNSGRAYLAVGGIVTRPTKALIGEAGPEAVIPLNQIRQVMADLGKSGGGGAGPPWLFRGASSTWKGYSKQWGRGRYNWTGEGVSVYLGRS